MSGEWLSDRGETEDAFVCKTDALTVSRAIILSLRGASGLYDRMTYPLALTIGSRSPEVRTFNASLTGSGACT